MAEIVSVFRTHLLGELVGVITVGIHVAERGWSAAVAEQHHQSMDTFRVVIVVATRQLADCP